MSHSKHLLWCTTHSFRHQCKRCISSQFSLHNGLKNNLKAHCYVTKHTTFWCNIATWFRGSFDVKHVSLVMCYTFWIQFRHENNIDTTYKLLVVFQKYVDTVSAIYQTCQYKKNYILRHSFRYMMQLKTIKLYHKAYGFDAILYSSCRSSFYVTNACFDEQTVDATRKSP